MVTTPELGLVVWNVSTDPYDSGQLAENFYRVDQHDHTFGKGRRITTGAIKDGSITQEKMAPGVSLPSSSIAPGQVGNPELAADAVTSNKILDGTVTGNDIAPNTVTSGNIFNGTVQGVDIALNTVASNNILDGTILPGDLSGGAVTLAKLAAGVGTRLLGAIPVPQLSAAANSTGTGNALTLAHNGKDAVGILILPMVEVVGGAQPYGAGAGILFDGTGFGAAAFPTTVLNSPFSVCHVIQRTALSGNHTWNTYVSMANNPDTTVTVGSGILVVFEQY